MTIYNVDRQIVQFNLAKGMAEHTAFTADGSGIEYLKNFISDCPPAVRLIKGPKATSKTVGVAPSAIKQVLPVFYLDSNGALKYKLLVRTSGGAYLDGTSISLPAADGLYSATYYKQGAVVARRGSSPKLMTLGTDGSPTITELSNAPKGGLVAGHNNTLFVSGCNRPLTYESLKIPFLMVKYPLSYPKKLQILATMVYFGKVVKFGRSSPVTVGIYNGYAVPLKITSIMPDGVDFAITQCPNLPCTVPPGGLISFTLEAAPIDVGVRDGNIIATTDMAKLFESSASWTKNGTTITANVGSGLDIDDDAFNGCYFASTNGLSSYEITDTSYSGSNLTLTTKAGSNSNGTGFYIKAPPVLSCPMQVLGTEDPLVASPSLLNYQMTVENQELPEQVIQICNPIEDDFTITGITCNNVTITKYSLDGKTYTNWPSPFGGLTLGPKDNLYIKVRPSSTISPGITNIEDGLTVQGQEPAQPCKLWWSKLNEPNKFIYARDYVIMKDAEGNGGFATAIVSYSDYLWIFMENKIYILSGYSWDTYRRLALPVGDGISICNPRSYVTVQGQMFFAATDGIYVAQGPKLSKISDPIFNTYSSTLDAKGRDCVNLSICGDIILVAVGDKYFAYSLLTRTWSVIQLTGCGYTSCSIPGDNVQKVAIAAFPGAGESSVFNVLDSADGTSVLFEITTKLSGLQSVNLNKRVFAVHLFGSIPTDITLGFRSENMPNYINATPLYRQTDSKSGCLTFLIPPDYSGTFWQFKITGSSSSSIQEMGLIVEFNAMSETPTRFKGDG